MTTYENESVHDAVGAYALGILDDAEATAFEAHLAGCPVCAAHLEEFSGLAPMLALLAEPPGPADRPLAPPGAGGPLWSDPPDTAYGDSVPRRTQPPLAFPGPSHHGPSALSGPGHARHGAPVPGPRSGAPGEGDGPMLGRLVDEVARKRAQRRRRTRLLVAAAAALIIGGPVAAIAATGGGTAAQDARTNQAAADPHPTSPAEDAFFHHMEEKLTGTDPGSKVAATVGLEKKGWGTHAVLELKNVKGPLKCRLVAVSKSGEEETVASWSVPTWGYGFPDSPHEAARSPLYVHGGAAMSRADIDRFEVRTFDGQRLVEVDA
ncbi:anti-sigma factor family protein [Streptomyces lichenis]|uniref:Zf-HC2 domain-containing protein n=1 Tax=Streptomyces lichenis TaxID=2306967 RepID=A0ABT0I5T6_9ACTN|nr:zf-HC2 domain-containing protein [Streptomyces lichenis]MCK8676689.1 zf-HC2 domain-containing protein [Streptomyces lichenis]